MPFGAFVDTPSNKNVALKDIVFSWYTIATHKEIIVTLGWVVDDRSMVKLIASKTDIHCNAIEPQVHCHK